MKIVIKNQQTRVPISKRVVKRLVISILKILKFVSSGELTILYTDNKAIQGLNSRYSGRNQPTDVLCFDISDGRRFVADIVISAEKACENAQLFNTSPNYELRLYLVHGILHLSGFDDRTKKNRQRMQRKAVEILKMI